MRRTAQALFPAILLVSGLTGCESKASEPPPKEGAPARERSPAASDAGPISVVTATFGKACGAAAGNHTQNVARNCNGKEQCAFYVTNPGVDPFPGCAKDFVVQYRCGTQTEVKTVEHPALAGENYTVDINCH